MINFITYLRSFQFSFYVEHRILIITNYSALMMQQMQEFYNLVSSDVLISNLVDAVGLMARNGSVPEMQLLSTSTATGTKTAAANVQESMWKTMLAMLQDWRLLLPLRHWFPVSQALSYLAVPQMLRSSRRTFSIATTSLLNNLLGN